MNIDDVIAALGREIEHPVRLTPTSALVSVPDPQRFILVAEAVDKQLSQLDRRLNCEVRETMCKIEIVPSF